MCIFAISKINFHRKQFLVENMVKNREELLKVAKGNASQLKTQIRQALISFMKLQKTNPEELSYALGISSGELNNLLSGTGSISVDTLSKLLVATDLAVEIKPVSATPLKAYGTKMPRCGGFKNVPIGIPIPVGSDGKPIAPPPFPPKGGFGPGAIPLGGMPDFGDDINDEEGFEPDTLEREVEAPQEAPVRNKPMRDAHGRFIRRSDVERNRPTAPRREPENPYKGLPARELINIIRNNIWDGEIDVDHASQAELADFVAEKERIMRERTMGKSKNAPIAEKKVTPVGSSSKLSQFLEMIGNMAEEAKNNPELAKTIARFMPK